jgi:hypothetical protein
MIEKTGGAAMTRYVVQWVVMGLILCLFSCSQDKSGQDLILAKINDYALTLNEFNTQLKEELEYDKYFKLNHDARKTFLGHIGDVSHYLNNRIDQRVVFPCGDDFASSYGIADA